MTSQKGDHGILGGNQEVFLAGIKRAWFPRFEGEPKALAVDLLSEFPARGLPRPASITDGLALLSIIPRDLPETHPQRLPATYVGLLTRWHGLKAKPLMSRAAGCLRTLKTGAPCPEHLEIKQRGWPCCGWEAENSEEEPLREILARCMDHPKICDHVKGRYRVVLWEPYVWGGGGKMENDLAIVRAWASEHGVTMRASLFSPYWPGQTVALMFNQDDRGELLPAKPMIYHEKQRS